MEQIKISLTKQEKEILSSAAAHRNQSVSSYVRSALFEEPKNPFSEIDSYRTEDTAMLYLRLPKDVIEKIETESQKFGVSKSKYVILSLQKEGKEIIKEERFDDDFEVLERISAGIRNINMIADMAKRDGKLYDVDVENTMREIKEMLPLLMKVIGTKIKTKDKE